MKQSLQGVVVGANQEIEWLIPWWWENYSKHSSLPVAFIDFGMTEQGRHCVRDKGELIEIEQLPSSTVCSFREDFILDSYYKEQYKEVRKGWIHKPFAMRATPFEQSLWLDLDCEVLCDVLPIFSYLVDKPSIAIVPDVNPHFVAPYTLYNGGVIGYYKDCAIISALCQRTLEDFWNFFGDDIILSALIHERSYPVVEMPYFYNWRASQGVDVRAKIFHWSGPKGKQFIKDKGGIYPLIQKMVDTMSQLGNLPRGDL